MNVFFSKQPGSYLRDMVLVYWNESAQSENGLASVLVVIWFLSRKLKYGHIALSFIHQRSTHLRKQGRTLLKASANAYNHHKALAALWIRRMCLISQYWTNLKNLCFIRFVGKLLWRSVRSGICGAHGYCGRRVYRQAGKCSTDFVLQLNKSIVDIIRGEKW